MRRPKLLPLVTVACCLAIPLAAHANPVIINPSSLIAFGVVAAAALIVAAGGVALVLVFSGLTPLRAFGAFLIINLAIYFFLFCPLLERIPLPALEALVVLVDCIAIKQLACFGGLQQEGFRSVTWLRAAVILVLGNAVSFFTGVIATDKPWMTSDAAFE